MTDRDAGRSQRSATYRALGRALRETRARRGLTQEALAVSAGLHRNYVGALERGEINPTLKVLLKAAHGLGVPVSDVLRLAETRYCELSQTEASGFGAEVVDA